MDNLLDELNQLDDELLVSVSSGLGAWHEDEQGNRVYVADSDCLGCLKDLQRFMRRDDPDLRRVFWALAGWDTVKKDLVPIITHNAFHHDLVLNALKVLTFLTMPVLPTSARPEDQAAQLRRMLEAVLSEPDALPVILGEAAEAVARHPRMNEDHTATLQIVLTLLRNLLAIPDAEQVSAAAGPGVDVTLPASGCTTGDGSAKAAVDGGVGVGAPLHARLLHALLQEEGMDLLTAVCHHAQDRPFKQDIALLLEVVHEALRGVDVQQLAAPPIPAPEPAPGATKPSNGVAGVAHSGTRVHGGAAAGPGAAAKDKRTAQVMQSLVAAEWAAKARLLRAGPRLHGRDTGRYVRHHPEHNAAVFVAAGSKANELPEMKVPAPTKGAKDGWLGGVEGGGAMMELPPRLLARLNAWAADFAASGAYDALMQVALRDVQAGLGISRLEAADLCRFMRIARTFAGFARLRQAQRQAQVQVSASPAMARAVQGAEEGPAGPAQPPPALPSMFTGLSVTLGWPCFQLLLTTWLGQVDIPPRSDMKNWELQHCCVSLLRELLHVLEAAQASANPHDAAAADRLQRRLLHDDLKESGLLPVLSRSARAFKPNLQPRGHAVDIIMSLACVVRTLDRLTASDSFLVRRRKRANGGVFRRKPAVEQGDETAGDGAGGDGDGGDAEGGGAGGDTAEQVPEGEGADETAGEAGGGGDGGGPTKARHDPLAMLHEGEGDEEDDDDPVNARVSEVSYNMEHRLRQEIGVPAMVHFLTIQGMAFYAHNSRLVNRAIAALLDRISSRKGLNLEPMMYQLSVLRVFHKLLGDASIRAKARLPDYQDLLVLATRVTRGLFAKLAPAPATEADVQQQLAPATLPGAAADGSGARGKGDGKDGGEAGSEAETADPDDGASNGGGGDNGAGQRVEAAAERAARSEAAIGKENKIRQGISAMLFIDIMFWKDARVAEEIGEQYFLRLKAAEDQQAGLRSAGHGADQAKAARGGSAWADQLGADDAEDTGMASGDEGGSKPGSPRDAARQGPASPPGEAAPMAAPGGPRGVAVVRDLAAEHAALRKLHQARKAGRGRRSDGAERGGAALNPADHQKLVAEFEQLNSNKANIDLLVSRLGGEEGGWTKEKVMRRLRGLGLRFGRLTEVQASKLRSLWQQHGSSAAGLQDALLMVAAEMSGGWTSRQVRALLRKEGLLAAGGRHRTRPDDDFLDDGSGGEDGEEGAAPAGVSPRDAELAARIDPNELRDAHGRHADEDEADMLQLVAIQLGEDFTPGAVRAALQKVGLIKRKAVGRRGGSGAQRKQGQRLAVQVAELQDLYEAHKDLPDALNRMAAACSVAVSAGQIQKLLVRAGIVPDEAAARRAARTAAERAKLVQLYQRHRAHSDHLQRMAEELPGATGAKDVLKLLRKYGLLDSGDGGGAGGRKGGSGGPRGGSQAGLPDLAVAAHGAVPEPKPLAVLQCLAGMQDACAGRWLDAAGAVAWLQGRLDAAQALWAASAHRPDYSLLMETDQDEAFFMTDFAQELLEAAGIRNDSGDFYKIPGNAGPGWVSRVRAALDAGLQALGTAQSAELLAQLKAAQAAGLPLSGGVGDAAAPVAAVDAAAAGIPTAAASPDPIKQEPGGAGPANGGSQGPEQAATARKQPSGRLGQMQGGLVALSSSEGSSGSDSGSSDGEDSSSSMDDAGGQAAAAPAVRRAVKPTRPGARLSKLSARRRKEARAPARKQDAPRSEMPEFSPSSASEGEGRSAPGQAAQHTPGALGDGGPSAKKGRGMGALPPRIGAEAPRVKTPAPGSTADARRAALAALTARRQKQAGLDAPPGPLSPPAQLAIAAGAAQATPGPRSTPGDAAVAKRRRLHKVAAGGIDAQEATGQENQPPGTAVRPVAIDGDGLEDF